jgi:hypothetical protein
MPRGCHECAWGKVDECKHGNTGHCALCNCEDEEHDAAMAAQARDDQLGLVERLRLQYPDTPHHRDALHREAADEIRRLRDALEGVLPYMEAAEEAGLIGDEGCHWPVEAVRLALNA